MALILEHILTFYYSDSNLCFERFQWVYSVARAF